MVLLATAGFVEDLRRVWLFGAVFMNVLGFSFFSLVELGAARKGIGAVRGRGYGVF